MNQMKWINFSLVLILVVGCTKKNNAGANNPTPVVKEMSGTLVPIGGNAYMVDLPAGAADDINKEGTINWQSASGFMDVYIRFQKAGDYTLGLRLKVPEGNSEITVDVLSKKLTLKAENREFKQYELGKISISDPGYVKVRLHGTQRTGPVFAHVTDLVVSGASSNLLFANDPENFYWSRRGPSVHMGYELPLGNYEYVYGELEVPAGEDKPGTFFMVNGFGEGYFGLQSRQNDRWVLFSVWDPSDNMTLSVESGNNVIAQRFGGEGTGGQSYLVYDWKAATTYKFITRIRPDGTGNTLYSAWFYAAETDEWLFINTWKRPGISTWQTRNHSFLENFYDKSGYLGRKAFYKNQWARSQEGNWVELTKGRHTVDATGSNKQRLDYSGGLVGNSFFLKMGGFFNEVVEPGVIYNRNAGNIIPSVDVLKLPNNQ